MQKCQWTLFEECYLSLSTGEIRNPSVEFLKVSRVWKFQEDDTPKHNAVKVKEWFQVGQNKSCSWFSIQVTTSTYTRWMYISQYNVAQTITQSVVHSCFPTVQCSAILLKGSPRPYNMSPTLWKRALGIDRVLRFILLLVFYFLLVK